MTALYLTGTSSIFFIEVEVLKENAATFSKPYNRGRVGADLDLSLLGTLHLLTQPWAFLGLSREGLHT